jgi:hypothetical protein
MSKESATTIRQPSTANLMADSQDRTQGTSAADFTISRNNSILNGFFTRIGVTEVVLEWFEPNISAEAGISFQFKESGSATLLTTSIPAGFYTVQSLLIAMATNMTSTSAASGASRTYTSAGISSSGVPGRISATGTYYFVDSSAIGFNPIPQRLGFSTGAASIAINHFVGEVITNVGGNGWTPDLRLYRYIDITSSSLTYNQDLKDASTAQSVDNILARWYFDWDSQPTLDGYGYPIFQGYSAFCTRRTFTPPKQVKWESNMPIGQLQFRVTHTPPGVNNTPQTLPDTTQFDWLMTLQVSEN